MARILVVDDDGTFRAVLLTLLAEDPELEVCGEVTSAEEALAAAERTRPDVVVLDEFLFGDVRGSEVAGSLREIGGGRTRVMLLTASRRHIDQAADIDAVVSKSDLDAVLPTIHALLRPAGGAD